MNTANEITYNNNGNVSSNISNNSDWRLLFGMNHCNPDTQKITPKYKQQSNKLSKVNHQRVASTHDRRSSGQLVHQ